MLAGERNTLAPDTCPANCQGVVVIEPSFLSPSSRGPSCHDPGSEKGGDELIMMVPFPWALPPSSALYLEDLANPSLWEPPASSGFGCATGNGEKSRNGCCLSDGSKSCLSNILSPSLDNVEGQEERGWGGSIVVFAGSRV